MSRIGKKPITVPSGVDVTIAGRVADITDGDDGSRTARIDLVVTVDGKKVLGKARATVRLQ